MRRLRPVIRRILYPAPAIVAGSTLRTGLSAWWELNEALGNSRVDAFGGNNFAESIANIPAVSGLVGNAADIKYYVDGGGRLEANDASAISAGDVDFSVAGWINFDALPASQITLIGKGTNGGQFEWFLTHTGTGGTNRFNFIVYNAADVSNLVAATTFGAPSTATWYFVACVCDKTNSLIKISVNAGTQDTAAKSITVNDGTDKLVLGNSDTNVDAKYDSWAYWKKAITPAEITQLYNGGAGLTYAATA